MSRSPSSDAGFGLGAWLRRQDGRGLQVSVITAAAVTYGILQALTVPRLQRAGGWAADLAAPLFSVLSLGALIFVIAQVFQRLRLGGFQGRWTYESLDKDHDNVPLRWAVATIGVQGFQITYSVDFFSSEADRRAFLAGRSSTDAEDPLRKIGTARGIASDFNGEHLWIMYEADFGAEGKRSGVLDLVPHSVNSWDRLDGRWVSHRKENPDGPADVLDFRRWPTRAAA